MKCQKCNINEANTHLTKIINGKKTEYYLCEKCAEEQGDFTSLKFGWDKDFDNFFSGFFSPSLTGATTETRCEKCKMTLTEFLNKGKAGCGDCYNAFRKYLSKPLQQLHHANSHKGRAPKRLWGKLDTDRKIENLTEKLNRAVLDQNFEEAAILRDEIKALKGEA